MKPRKRRIKPEASLLETVKELDANLVEAGAKIRNLEEQHIRFVNSIRDVLGLQELVHPSRGLLEMIHSDLPILLKRLLKTDEKEKTSDVEHAHHNRPQPPLVA